jgi:hypothetical protein
MPYSHVRNETIAAKDRFGSTVVLVGHFAGSAPAPDKHKAVTEK